MTYDEAIESAVTQFNALYPGLGDFFREENEQVSAEDVASVGEYLGRQNFADSHFTLGFFIGWFLPNGPPSPHDYFWDALQDLAYDSGESETPSRGRIEVLLKEFPEAARAIVNANTSHAEAEAFLL